MTEQARFGAGPSPLPPSPTAPPASAAAGAPGTPLAQPGGPPGQASVPVVDVEQRRYDVLEGLVERVAGEREASVLARMGRRRRMRLANFKALVQVYGAHEDLSELEAWAHNVEKGHIRAEKPLHNVMAALSQQGEKRGALERLLRHGGGPT